MASHQHHLLFLLGFHALGKKDGHGATTSLGKCLLHPSWSGGIAVPSDCRFVSTFLYSGLLPKNQIKNEKLLYSLKICARSTDTPREIVQRARLVQYPFRHRSARIGRSDRCQMCATLGYPVPQTTRRLNRQAAIVYTLGKASIWQGHSGNNEASLRNRRHENRRKDAVSFDGFSLLQKNGIVLIVRLSAFCRSVGYIWDQTPSCGNESHNYHDHYQLNKNSCPRIIVESLNRHKQAIQSWRLSMKYQQSCRIATITNLLHY